MAWRTFRNWSLSTKLLAVMLASSVGPLVAAGGLIFSRGRDIIRVDVEKALAAHADGIARELDTFHASWSSAAVLSAELPAAWRLLQREGGGDWRARVGEFFQGTRARHPEIRIVSLIGRDGVVVASSDTRAQGVDVARRAYFTRALAGEVPAGYFFIPSEVLTEPLLAYSAPVRTPSGEVVGVVAVFVDANALWAAVKRANDRIWPGSYVVVDDELGVRVAHSTRQELVFHPTGPLPANERAAQIEDRRFAGRTAELLDAVVPEPGQFARARSPTGGTRGSFALSANETSGQGERLGMARRLGAVPWTVLAIVPREALTAPVAELVSSVIESSALAVLFALLLAVAFGRIITGPLRKLVEASSALARGEQVARLEVGGSDELGQLLGRFNEMAEAVTEGRTRLEERVKLRTAELELANSELRAQKDELGAQGTELRVQQEELAAQTVELERKNADVERANRLKSEFLANMSHELRTPLNSVIGFSELVRDEAAGELSERHHRFLGDVLTSGRHLLGLINDILDLSKIEAGHLELEREALVPTLAMGEAVDLVRAVALKRRINVKLENATERTVFADRAKLRQVLLNLLGNALKFSPEGSTTTVGAADEGDSVRFFVRDEGPGISTELMPRLFEPFVQGESPLVKQHQGTGLGLAICKRLVERHGGTIEVKSAPGATTFSFTMPAAVPPLVPVGQSVEGMALVLLLESEPARALQLREKLRAGGYAVEVPLDGEGAVAAASRLRPAVVVLDPVVNGSDGLAVLSALKRDAATRWLPLVLTTAPHAEGVLPKPLDSDEVLVTVRRVLRARATAGAEVLVVDDDARARELLVSLLTPVGYRVHAVEGAALALKRARERRPDVILTDLMMPDVSGFEFVDTLAADEQLREVPVIVLTALELTLEQRERLKRHVFATAKKGDATTDEVFAAVGRALRRAPAVEPRTGPGPTVLVVDDHDLNRGLAQAVLERRGYRVLVADGGAAGIELARRERPALVLMDLAMPGIDGFAALAALRADPATVLIPVLALTAHAMKGDEQKARAAGFEDYLTKPIDRAVLEAAVEKALRKGR